MPKLSSRQWILTILITEDILKEQIIASSQTFGSSYLTGNSVYLDIVQGTTQFLFLTVYRMMGTQSSESENF